MQSTKGKDMRINRLPLVMAMLGCLYGTTAMAQDATQGTTETQTAAQKAEKAKQDAQSETSPAAATKPTELDRITVTGSLLRRAEYDSASPLQVITADTSVAVGMVNPAEFLQQSSVAAGSTQINNQFGGFVIEGGLGVQTVSLRGLGANRSLVLLNGHRPGPAGTRGQVGAFDLNVIPTSILQRAEILKDGSSSIYGSDAVAGVVNLITRKSVDRPEISVSGRVPLEGGGEFYSASGATGWNFDKGSIVLAAEYQKYEPLKVGDRDFFKCPQDLIKNSSGKSIDRQDRSITAGTPLGGCNNLYANTVIDAFTGRRYIPSPDGVTIGLIPGYRPRTNQSYTGSAGQAYYEDVLNFDFYGQQYVLNGSERYSVYASSNFSLGAVNWATEFLYTHREAESKRFRQFFPLIGGATAPAGYQYANSPGYSAPVPSGVAQPVIPFRSNSSEKVDFYYINTNFDGLFSWTDTWAWNVNASYSRSDGDYTGLGIVASRSGDLNYDDNAPTLDYFSPGILSGARMDDLQAAIGEENTGNTVYDQAVFTGVVTGDLFNLPAGAVAGAFGAEYRRFSIDDNPSQLSQSGDLWGQSSAQVTRGKDHVTEIFGEVEVPLLKGLPGVESLTANVSARRFKYNSVADADDVWKAGLSWQVIPSIRLRATKGTSYRAPGLYELYLGNQTGFLSQLSIDPCIDWPNSTNDNLRANCAAIGIPANYTGAGSSATIVSGGGAGVLKPEKSNAKTVGIVFTPTFADFSVALDYFAYEVNDEIGQLGAGAILGGCYGSPVFPNAFCNLFDRNPGTDPTAPYQITEVRDSYLNINKQKVRGYDLLVNFKKEFAAGKLEVQGEATYTMEDFQLLFDSDQPTGFETDDFNGDISRPRLVGNLRTSFERGDWTYTWFMNYVQGTEAINYSPTTTYQGLPNSVRDIKAGTALYHTLSVFYEQPNWSVLLGMRNIFGTTPPEISSGTVSRYGNTPAFATQYDWYGRTLFARFNYKF